jgi:hypothetical protein
MGSLSAKDCFGPRDSSWLISAIVGHGKPWVGFDTNSLLMLSEKARECFERGRRCMVFHAFRIGLRDFGRNTDGDQQRDHQSMSRPDLGREVQARLGQEDPTIGPRGYKPFPLEAADALERRRMRDAEPLGDFSCARLAMGYMQISDEFDVVLGQSGRARRTRTPEPRCLRRFGRQVARNGFRLHGCGFWQNSIPCAVSLVPLCRARCLSPRKQRSRRTRYHKS